MLDYENSYHNLEVDEFGDIQEIHSTFPRNYLYDNTPDNLLGLGNKKKKAERKLRKAEKKLEKGKTKQAERKIRKAEKLLGQVQGGIDVNQPKIDAAYQQIQNINAATQPTSTIDTTQTESMNTSAGQIGSNAMPPTTQPEQTYPSYNSSGSGGGSMDMGYTPETSLASPTPEESSLSTPDNPITLPEVTVTAHKKNNTILLIVAVIILGVLAYMFLGKKGTSKKLFK